MFISMNWIQDFVDLSGLDLIGLIKRFTLSTAEVEEILTMGQGVKNVVVGKVENIENHPDSKKLHLLKVNIGESVVDCVCGAPNVREGMKVAFAKVGGCAGGMEIKEAKIAGYLSCGMCCSEQELGISADHSGLMELPKDAVVGTDIKKLYQIDDIVFEVDNKSLTNRPDLWGHYGIAREFSAISGRKLMDVPVYDTDTLKSKPQVDIRIEDKENGYRYTSAIISNVTERVSPVNMRIRLFYCGLRAINLLADLTNYVMLELGQPMHAFDYAKVKSINVRRFDKPFEFATLDGAVRSIDENTLMICSEDTPMAIAGIMGGLDSEITDSTNSLLLESANFNGINIRKTSTRLGLRTDASMRYEKMLAPELTDIAAKRYLKLLCDIDKGARIESALSDEWVYSFPEVTIEFNKAYVDRYTGIDISTGQIESTLFSLGFDVKRREDQFTVGVPPYRRTKDVTIKADIIEEITRIYGYDNFEIRPSDSLLKPVAESTSRRDDFGVKSFLTDKYCLNEVHSYLWCDSRRFKEIGIEVEDNVKIINSLSTDWTILRSSMIPTLLTMVNDNKLYAPSFGIFEIGRVVDGLKADGTCNERKRLGIVLFDKTQNESAVYKKLIGIVCAACKVYKNTAVELISVNAEKSWQHPANAAEVLLDKKKIGSLYAIHPSVSRLIDKKAVLVAAEIDMDSFSAIKGIPMKFEEPSKFPCIEYDLSLLVDKDAPYSDIAAIIMENPCDVLKSFKPVDVYSDASLSGKKSLSVRLVFGTDDRTLASDEVQKYVDALIDAFAGRSIFLKG